MTHRLYCLTDFVLDKKFWEDYYEEHSNLQYVFAGSEVCETTSKAHWQMYMYFKNPVKFSVPFIKGFDGRHLEPCKGSLRQNEKYCSKEGNPAFELGKKPAAGQRTDLEQIRDDIKNGVPELTIATDNFSQWCQYSRQFERYRELVEPKRNWVTKVIVRWGEPGSGKSRIAYEAGATPITFANGFIVGYNGQETVVFDDFEGYNMPRSVFLTLTDRYPCTINVKGGSRNWAPRTIYITSNTRPELWYGDEKAVMRRISEVSEVVVGNTSHNQSGSL